MSGAPGSSSPRNIEDVGAPESVSLGSNLRHTLADFAPSRLAATLTLGVLAGVILVTLTISLAALVFRGDLADHLPIGVGLALFGTLAIGIVGAIGSGLDGVVAGVQDNTAAVIGAAAAAIAASVAADQAFPTVLALIVTTSVITALALGGIGVFRLGALVRFIPYPVIGGFLVATGVLILDGARSVLVDGAEGAEILSWNMAVRWVPGVALGIVMVLLARSNRGRTALPWVVAGTIVATHVGLLIADVSRTTATSRGWLLGGFDDQALWRPDTLQVIGDADWGAVAGQGGAIVTVVALAAISLMIKVHAIDQATGVDLDVDRELRVAGVSTAAAAAGGGLPGYMHYAQTLMLRSMGGPRRGAALVAALTAGLVLATGSSVLNFVPTSVVGGILVYLGLTFLLDWLWDRRTRLDRADMALIVGAGIAVIVLGFLPAIALGTVVAIVLFVVRYSRVDAVRHSYSLRIFRSTIERSPKQAAYLEGVGDRAIVLEVHGFLFFGTAHRVFDDSRLDNPDRRLRYLVFDMSRVTGTDSSSSMALAKLARRGQVEGFQILLSGLPQSARGLTAQLPDNDPVVHTSPTLDGAVEWCETQLLAGQPADAADDEGLLELLADVLDSPAQAQAVLAGLEYIELEPGSALIRQGDDASGIYFIESGTLTAQIETDDGETVRLRTMQPGTLIGEISLYLGGDTTADVVADDEATVFHLSPEALAEMEESNPAASSAIHRLAAGTLAGRVLHAERALRTLRD